MYIYICVYIYIYIHSWIGSILAADWWSSHQNWAMTHCDHLPGASAEICGLLACCVWRNPVADAGALRGIPDDSLEGPHLNLLQVITRMLFQDNSSYKRLLSTEDFSCLDRIFYDFLANLWTNWSKCFWAGGFALFSISLGDPMGFLLESGSEFRSSTRVSRARARRVVHS